MQLVERNSSKAYWDTFYPHCTWIFTGEIGVLTMPAAPREILRRLMRATKRRNSCISMRIVRLGVESGIEIRIFRFRSLERPEWGKFVKYLCKVGLRPCFQLLSRDILPIFMHLYCSMCIEVYLVETSEWVHSSTGNVSSLYWMRCVSTYLHWRNAFPCPTQRHFQAF